MKRTILILILLALASSFVYAEELRLTPKYYDMTLLVNESVERVSFIQVPGQKAYDWAFFKNGTKATYVNNQTEVKYQLKVPRNTEPGFYNLTYSINSEYKVLEIEIVNPWIMSFENSIKKKINIFGLDFTIGTIVLSIISIILFIWVIVELIKFINN